MKRPSLKDKLLSWNKSQGGIYFPAEIEKMDDLHREDSSPTGLRDRHFMKGMLSLFVYPEGDREQGEVRFCHENLIVDKGRESIALMISDTGGGHSAKGVRDLGFGAVGKGSGNGSLTPQPTHTGLFDESTAETPVGGATDSGVARKALAYTQPLPGPPFMNNLWTFQIASNEMNGGPWNIMNEVGIYSLDHSSLFSFRTFSDQTKTSGLIFEWRWVHLF